MQNPDEYPQLASAFLTLPPDYQALIHLAQKQYAISISPLQELLGGWSGAMIYLVSVSYQVSKRIEHYVLKLDRKNPKARSDEITRHAQALASAPPEFAHNHMAATAFDRIEQNGAIAIFYAIAGQSLIHYQPLSRYERQDQLKQIFSATYRFLLDGWNADKTFEQATYPLELLNRWLGFRLKSGGNIEQFISGNLKFSPDTPGFILHEKIFPNPLFYARQDSYWDKIRPLDTIHGFFHGDLNTNNILVKFSPDSTFMDGYYLIDFALFKEGIPLLYDQRYLEMSYLILKMNQIPFARLVELLVYLGEVNDPDPALTPVEMAGISLVIGNTRKVFEEWVQKHHPSLVDDLWGQYWLAGVAAGLSYTHKTGLPENARLAGWIYAAANLKRFANLFGLAPPNLTQQLFEPSHFTSYASTAIPVVSPLPATFHNLPNQPTTFIGREGQITATRNLLSRKDVRLVTLTGPGGTGKTRLAIEVVTRLLDQFPDGIIFVALADVREPNQIVSKIAQQLEVREAGSRPLLENVKSYLENKSLLLLLDNFEQVVSAAPLVAEILLAAPSLKILVTSRITLNLRSEHIYPVPPLEIPLPENLPPLENLKTIDSVRLFLDRAQAIQPEFSLTERNAAAVAEICHYLDGLPLAIELAAARMNLLSPQALLARLGDRLKLLTGGARDLPIRQQTLRNTIDWSYQLLSDTDQTLFVRLSVFVGGFDLEAAEAICNSEGDMDVFKGVGFLVDNSLLRQEVLTDSQPKFRMLETIRSYASDILERRNEITNLRQLHAHYYAHKLIDEMGFKIYSVETTDWLNWIEVEWDNIEATLAWSQHIKEGYEWGPPLIAFLTWFWYRRGYFHEGRRWAERVLRSPAAQEGSLGRAMVLQGCSLLAMWQADLRAAQAWADECLELWQNLDNDRFLGIALINSGIILINKGEDATAHPILERAQALFKQLGDQYFCATTLVHLGNVALGLGKPQEAQDWLKQAYSLSQEIGEVWTISFALNNLGEVARVQGDYAQASNFYQQSESLLANMGDKGDLARLIHNRGYMSLYEGDHMMAENRFRKSLSMFHRLGNQRGIAETLAGLARLHAVQGRPLQGAQLLGAAQNLMDVIGAAWWPADRIEIERSQKNIESRLSLDDYKAALSAGKQLKLEEAVSLAYHQSIEGQ